MHARMRGERRVVGRIGLTIDLVRIAGQPSDGALRHLDRERRGGGRIDIGGTQQGHALEPSIEDAPHHAESAAS